MSRDAHSAKTAWWSRRRLLVAGAIGVPVAAALLRPGDRGGAHSDYFNDVQNALAEAGLYRPTLVLDYARLQHNLARLKSHLPAGMGYRAVAKSLPALDLLNTVGDATGSRRLMLFHQPFLNHVAQRIPEAQILLGKPMPAGAAQQFYLQHGNPAFDPSRQLEWLIDTPERLRQYRELASGLGQRMRINLELDVGLHRGGFDDNDALAKAITALRDDRYLQFSGLMGYEAHISKMPGIVGGPDKAFATAMRKYGAAVDTAKAILGQQFDPAALTLNAGGSSTYQMYDGSQPCNELAMGSGLVKPSDFDVHTLQDHLPAAFIATPVLKTADGIAVPGLESASPLWRMLNPNRSRSWFVYGGFWKATPVSPPGLSPNAIYGRSTNQEMLNGSNSVDLRVDEYVFYRPHQSEFVFLQFGDIAVYENGHIVGNWPVFSEGA